MSAELEKELRHYLQLLPAKEQRRVLDFARSLTERAEPNGHSSSSLRRFAGTITDEDLLIIEETIREGCERVDADEW